MNALDLRCPCCGSKNVRHDHRARTCIFVCGTCDCASDGTVGSDERHAQLLAHLETNSQ